MLARRQPLQVPEHRPRIRRPAPRSRPAVSAGMGSLRPQVVLFGDSLTQRGQENGYGWASLLADAYSRKARALELLRGPRAMRSSRFSVL